MKLPDRGVHYVHFIAPSKILTISAILFTLIMITISAYQENEIQELRKEVNKLRSYYTRMTGEFL